MRAVGMAGKMAGRQKVAAGKTQPAEQGTAGGHSQRILRPAQASNERPTVGRWCSKNNRCRMMASAFLSPCRYVGEVQWYW